MRLAKACEVEDFAPDQLGGDIREIFAHELARFGPAFPVRAEYRKHWEVAIAVRALGAAGVLRPGRRVLGVGAGNEPTAFWLTNFVDVHATDLYLSAAWAESANVSMLVDPGHHWPGRWDRRRLVVQHMDARELHYPDDSFDAVFSSSSLEHFGSDEEISVALDEIHRVLRPGGVCSLSTELRVAGEREGLPDVRMFTAQEFTTLIRGERAWTPLEPFSGTVSEATLAATQPFSDAAADVRAHVAQHGEVVFAALRFSRYPHITLREGDLVWTSAHIALVKD